MANTAANSNHEEIIWSLSYGYKSPSRRTTRLHAYDPESLLSGEEIASGCDYTNSRRRWSNLNEYEKACSGEITPEQILRIAPRMTCAAADSAQNQLVDHPVDEPEACNTDRVEVGHE